MVMRPFLTILLICAITMQLEAWPWRSRAQKKQSQAQESGSLLETPPPEAQKEGGEIPETEVPDEALAVESPAEATTDQPAAESPAEATTDQPAAELAAVKLPAEEAFTEEIPAEEKKAVVSAEKYSGTGRSILGKGKTRAENLVSFLLSENKNAGREFIEELVRHYIAEAEAEGINHDIAFAQMCLETGYLRFGGLVSPDMNNFCGLGSIGPGIPGASFPTAQLGIRAHIQHLQAYATDLPLQGQLVDPRYHLVRRGSVPEVQGLAGSWAADRHYAEKIESILGRLYRFEEPAEE